jgi:RHS repeat-associated protein
VLYYYQDQLGSIRALLDGSGKAQATYVFDAYGNVTSTTGTVSNPFQFAGQYTDSESGLQYLRARYYDPNTEQFLTVDPLADVTGQPYGYASDSPLNQLDPTGLWSPGDLASGVAHAVGAVAGQVGSTAKSLWSAATTPQPRTLPRSRTVGGVVITAEGILRIREHLSRFADEYGGPYGAPYNEEMLGSLGEKLVTGCAFTQAEVSFYEHELYEANLMDQGYSYEEAHALALAKYDVEDYDLYPKDVYLKYREWMYTPEWDEHFGIESR